jgi:putative ABC transport system ATP-binding protein
MSSRPLLLQTCNLGRRADGRWLLGDVSIEIRGGDRLAVVGATGSGKTLLLRALAMLDPTDAGKILWHGCEIRGNEVPTFRSRMTYLHQRPATFEGTVEDNLKQPFALRVHRDKPFNRAAVLSRLASLNRDDAFLSKPARDLSGGESQIMALLRAIQLDPEVLLLDEPTSALDSQAAQTVERLVENWLHEQSEQRAAVWVTHDRQQASRIGSRVLEMSDGSLNPAP